MIHLTDLHFEYSAGRQASAERFVLDVPSLHVPAGAHAACIGPSGSGKTTLVNLIAGILAPQAGSVRVGDVELSGRSDDERRAFRLRRIGMVFQEFELLEHLSAMDNIRLPFLIGAGGGGEGRESADSAADLAAAVGISHVLRRKPRRLSHGERQRVGICRALITRPSLLLCDEPTGNLDPASTAATLDVLLDQAASRGATLVMVTHNHALLDRFDRVIDMSDFVAPVPRRGGGGRSA